MPHTHIHTPSSMSSRQACCLSSFAPPASAQHIWRSVFYVKINGQAPSRHGESQPLIHGRLRLWSIEAMDRKGIKVTIADGWGNRAHACIHTHTYTHTHARTQAHTLTRSTHTHSHTHTRMYTLLVACVSRSCVKIQITRLLLKGLRFRLRRALWRERLNVYYMKKNIITKGENDLWERSCLHGTLESATIYLEFRNYPDA